MGDRPVPDARPLGELPARNPKVAARVIHGEAMILTPHDSVLHTLNPVATRVWELLPTHRTLESMAQALAEEYDVDPATAKADVEELTAQLVVKKILE
ncbi:MAG: PqqD family protein [Candidatus Sericytochromatia bacterium]